MITPIKSKTLLKNACAVQNLVFEQKLYGQEKINDQHSDLVNLLYDLQHWHYFWKTDLSFDDKISQFNKLFGPYSLHKKLPEKGTTYIWNLEVNGSKYSVFMCDYACFIETLKKTPFDQACSDIKEIAQLVFQDAKQKPRILR